MLIQSNITIMLILPLCCSVDGNSMFKHNLGSAGRVLKVYVLQVSLLKALCQARADARRGVGHQPKSILMNSALATAKVRQKYNVQYEASVCCCPVS